MGRSRYASGSAEPCPSRRWSNRYSVSTVALSYAIADEQIHAPNEFFRLSSFDDGLRAWTELLEEAARRA